MKRLIHLMSLAALAIPSSAHSHISARFLDSVDRANEAVSDTAAVEHRRRRKLGWWGVALFFAEHAPCHGPLQPPHCHHHHHSSSGGGSSGSSGSGSGGGGDYAYSDDAYWKGGSSSWGSDGYSTDGSSASGSGKADSTSSASYETANSGSNLMNPNAVSFWMLLAAAGAVAVAIAAVIVGSRRKEKENYHPLRGAVEKRMKLFGGFSEKCFGDRELCGADKELEVGELGVAESEKNGYKAMV
ncbi:hypothetical protein HJC23_005131 [Cyclotella cryptica]|uniref:Uncharacterized protein n=1 Tax=Cyclotella cryptica TaxID=29204 RepID=A0ABD3QFW0_9STRA|eukprot:CCRYP_005828-RA/>CCRYP_005828-RA protein AED:0.13 eAED:0.13 QI:329/1/1/1/1/1/2/802/242